MVNNLPNDPSNPAANPVRNMHIPGAGVGGHCLPKDSWLLKYGVDNYGKFPVESKVIIGSREVNDYMPIHMAELTLKALKEAGIKPEEAKVTILGYAFLENSDDTRNTPAVPLITELKAKGIRNIVIHDPFVRKEELAEVERDLNKALEGSDCACLVTSHDVYKDIVSSGATNKMRIKVIIDGRNVIAKKMRDNCRVYYTLGIGQ